MSELLNDELNIRVLKCICDGIGIDVNITYLADKFHKHRNTISSKVSNLIDSKIIVKPFFPLKWIFTAYPLMVFEKSHFPRDPSVNKWIEKDPYIFAAFFVKDEEYNTFLIELHKDLYTFQNWKEGIQEGKGIFPSGFDYSSEAIFFSTRSMIKHSTDVSINIIRENIAKGIHSEINDLTLDDLTLNILETLLKGEAISINYNLLANHLDVHRKTIQRRIELLTNEKIIAPAVCRFPRIWSPPEYNLVYSLFELKNFKNRVLNSLTSDNHVTFIIKGINGRYNLLLLSSFYRMEDYLKWNESYEERFPNSIGAVKNLYLSPEMTFSINQNYVPLTYLDKILEKIYGKTLMETVE